MTVKNNQTLQHPLFLWLITLLLGVAVFAGCFQEREPLLRVATNVWPGYETLYLARSLGYFDDRSIRLVEMPSASQVSQALRNGTIEAGCLTLDETLSLLQDGVDLRVILIMDVSHGADVVMARPGIYTLKALRKQRVGVESTAEGAIMLDAALEAGGLNVQDIRIVPLTPDEHAEAYIAGKVDAIVTFEPVRSQLLKAGAHILFDSSQVPGRIIDVLVVRAEMMAPRRKALEDLVRGHFRAKEYLEREHWDAAMRMMPRLHGNVLAQFTGIRLSDMDENRIFLSGEAPRLNSVAHELADLMLRRKLLQRPVVTDSLADPSCLPWGTHE